MSCGGSYGTIRKCQMIVEHPITTTVIIMATINTTIPLTHALSPFTPTELGAAQAHQELRRRSWKDSVSDSLYQVSPGQAALWFPH